jgi:hypothetical protein
MSVPKCQINNLIRRWRVPPQLKMAVQCVGPLNSGPVFRPSHISLVHESGTPSGRRTRCRALDQYPNVCFARRLQNTLRSATLISPTRTKSLHWIILSNDFVSGYSFSSKVSILRCCYSSFRRQDDTSGPQICYQACAECESQTQGVGHQRSHCGSP